MPFSLDFTSIFRVLLWSVLLTDAASACLVCSVPYQSLLDKIEADSDVVVARLMSPRCTDWQVEDVVKGSIAKRGQAITTRLESGTSIGSEARLLRWNSLGKFWMEDGPADREFLGFANRAIELSATRTQSNSIRSQRDYFRFFVPYLEHSNPLIADAAHARISTAPYQVLRELGDLFTSGQLLNWIDNQPTDVPPERRRDALYITLLGICGGEAESNLLSQWISRCWVSGRSDQLGAILTAHGELNGEATVELIEEQYIRNSARTLEEINEAVKALRVHGQAGGTISRERVQAAYRLLVRERKPLLELVVDDCQRWQDWTIAAMLMEVYSGGGQPWNHELILKYLRACPLPEARDFISGCDE